MMAINAVTGLVLLLCCTTTAALRLLASGLTPAERLAATSAVDAELVEFSSARRALLVADGDEDLLPVLMGGLDSASDTPLPATPVFVAAVPAAHTAAEADEQCEAAMREHIDAYSLRQPIHPAKKARRCKPHAHAELDGATLNDGRFDRSAVVAIDGLVDEKLRAQLLDLIGGTEHEALSSHWSKGVFGDTMDDAVRGSGLGLKPEVLDTLCAEPPDGEIPAPVKELQSRIARYLQDANGGRSAAAADADASDAAVDVCRMPFAVFGESVTPLAANAPISTDGPECYGWHIDADPLLLPPSPFTDIYGRYSNRQPGCPRFVTALIYLSKVGVSRVGRTNALPRPSDREVLEIPPSPGRVVILDQDLSHAVTSPLATAGDRPRYSLALKLILHPNEAGMTPSIAPEKWGPPVRIGSANSGDDDAMPPSPPSPSSSAAKGDDEGLSRRDREKALYKKLRRLSAAKLWSDEVPRFNQLTTQQEREEKVSLVRAVGNKFATNPHVDASTRNEVVNWLVELLSDESEGTAVCDRRAAKARARISSRRGGGSSGW